MGLLVVISPSGAINTGLSRLIFFKTPGEMPLYDLLEAPMTIGPHGEHISSRDGQESEDDSEKR